MEERIPPHNPDAERSVLGAALLSEDALFDVVEVVKPEDFYDPNHKEIFSVIYELNKKNAPVDALTVSEELDKRGSLELVGGRAYVAGLSSSTPTTANAGEYAKIVAEKASIRRLIAKADDIVVKGYDKSMDAGQLLDYAENGIFEISQERQKGAFVPLKDVLISNIDAIDKASKLKDGLTGVTTGFRDLDAKTSGLQKSELIILAARPAMGKTAFALSLALNAAVKGGASVMVFSMEMSKEALGQRLLAMESKVEMQKLKTGRLERRDWDDVNIALEVLSGANIFIDDTAGISTGHFFVSAFSVSRLPRFIVYLLVQEPFAAGHNGGYRHIACRIVHGVKHVQESHNRDHRADRLHRHADLFQDNAQAYNGRSGNSRGPEGQQHNGNHQGKQHGS